MVVAEQWYRQRRVEKKEKMKRDRKREKVVVIEECGKAESEKSSKGHVSNAGEAESDRLPKVRVLTVWGS